MHTCIYVCILFDKVKVHEPDLHTHMHSYTHAFRATSASVILFILKISVLAQNTVISFASEYHFVVCHVFYLS